MTVPTIVSLLFLSLMGSLLLILRASWRLLFGLKGSRWAEFFFVGLSVASACALSVDLLDEAKVHLFGERQVYASMGCMFLIAVVAWVSLRAVHLRGSASSMRVHWFAWLLLLLPMISTGWSLQRLNLRNSYDQQFGINDTFPGTIVPEVSNIGITDKGRVIRLYRLQGDDQAFQEFAQHSFDRFASYRQSMILRHDADKMANCHGWVFTDGHFLLRGDEVASILEDNGYEETQTPGPGDIVIYRDELDGIRHTGLVQGLLKDGTVIIESKWGIDQRFLHRPEDQPYSKHFKYYHTRRPDHFIPIRPNDDLNEDDV